MECYRHHHQIVCVLLLLLVVVSVNGFRTGPPISACLLGQPMHMNMALMAQTMRMELFPPYTRSVLYSLDVNDTTYSTDGVLEVTLRARNSGTTFKGFILRAVRASELYTNMTLGPLLGSFSCDMPLNMTLRYVTAYSPDNMTNCVTHAATAAYTQLKCRWTAPSTNEGPVRFLATAVQQYNSYQYLASSDLNCSVGAAASSMGSPVLAAAPSAAGCGVTKTCALYPPMCDTRGGCTHGVTMMRRPDSSLLVEMFGTTVDWLGMGIADSTEMVNMELFVCTWDMWSQTVTLETAYSPVTSVSPVYRPMVRMRQGMIMRNQSSTAIPAQPTMLACSFVMSQTEQYTMYTVNRSTRVDGSMVMNSDLSKGKFFVLAQGMSIGGGSKMPAQHQTKPLMSPMRFMPDSPQKMYFGGLSRTVQIHATLLTIFWLFLAAFAIIIARHSRPVFNQQAVLKKDLWFILHIAFILIGFVLGVAGIIVMLVNEGGWSSSSQTHGIIGLIGMGLALVNILMGLFRPEPDSKFRWIFNRLHRYNGLLALLFATIAIWLGATFMENRPQFRLWAIIVLAVWTGLQIVFMFGFECVRQNTVKTEEFKRAIDNKYRLNAMNGTEPAAPDQQEPIKGKRLRHVGEGWLFLYGAVFLAVAAAFWAGLWMH